MERRSRTRSARTIRFLSSAGYNKVIIAYRNGSPVRLSDVANAVDSAENLYQAAWMGTSARAPQDGQPARPATLQPAVIVNIQRQPGANIIGVVDEVQKILPQLRVVDAGDGEPADSDGPDEYDSRVGEGCAVLADADHWRWS